MKFNRLKIGSSKKSHKKGFTLIELLISIVLFTIFLGIVSQSYLSIVRAQRQANEVRKMYSEVRVFMDDLAEDIRLGSIDYDCYGFQSVSLTGDALCDSDSLGTIVGGRSSVLSLVKKGGGEKITYKIVADVDGKRTIKVKKWYQDYATQGWLPVAGYEDFRSVFSERLDVEYATFAIFPDVNPYSSLNYLENAVQFQPKVTLFLSVRSANSTTVKFDYQFQTSISSRVYTREK